MPLGAPAVIGPVSTCSRFVRVEGQFSGSRVRLFVDGDPVPVGDDVVAWASATIAVDRTRLVAGKTVRAEQTLGTETSARSPMGQVIDLAKNGLVTAPHTLYACAESLFVANCCPGARLEVWQAGSLLGSADAIGADAWIAFNAGQRLQGGSQVEVRQFICTGPAAFVTKLGTPVQPPADQDRRLASPVFREQLEECQRLVPLGEIVTGAVVRLEREGTPVWDGSVPHPAVNILVDGLRAGEEFAVSQSMPRCEYRESDPNRTRVRSLTALKRPTVAGPLCAGAHQVTLDRLKPGATVRVLSGGNEIGRWEAAGFSMPVDINVPAPATIVARQELCGIVSPDSKPYTAASGRSGRWVVVEDANGDDLKAHSFAIHAALARSGKIVMFSGDQHNSAQNRANPQDIDHCELFDCGTLGLQKIDAPTTDVFCSGHAFLPDGRLLVVGGTEDFPPGGDHFHQEHFPGLAACWLFNPTPPQDRYWTRTRPTRGGRWYPTPITLPNGSVLALSGHPEGSDTSRHNNHSMETYASGSWTFLGDSPDIDSGVSRYLYPRVFVGPTGAVFSATPIAREFAQDPGRSAIWGGPPGVAWARSAGPRPGGWGNYDGFTAPAVLLPLLEDADPGRSFRARVLLAGEAQPWILDLGSPANPLPNGTWQALGNRTRRLNSNLVLLPSGEVLLCGGVGDPQNDATAVNAPEVLVPSGNSWAWDNAAFAQAAVPRNYHSTALLMPDGRVFTGGSNINAAPGGPNVRRLELELYEPWYYCAERPKILKAPTSIAHGARLRLTIRSKEPISRIALVRAGSATHGFNHDQRYIGLLPMAQEGEDYFCTIPAKEVAVPGYYLVHAVTDRRVPSEGVFVRVG